VIAGAATVAAAALLGGLVVGWPGLALFSSPPSEVPVEALPISDIEPDVAQPEPVLPDKPAEVPAVRRPEPRPIVADPIVAVRQVIPGPGRAKGHDKGKGNGHDKDKKGGQDGHGGRGRGDEDNSGPGGGKD
jgi:hypothetical protein